MLLKFIKSYYDNELFNVDYDGCGFSVHAGERLMVRQIVLVNCGKVAPKNPQSC
jgi:hypothetical protein